MKRFKSEKGVITMITLITVVFMISFLITSFIVISNKVKTQKEILAETKAIYEPKLTMEEIYNSQFNYESVIPIYTVEQLLSIGSNKKINIDGKVYIFSDAQNIAYLLKNDLEFNAIDLNLENDWIPMYENEDFLGDFDWNGHTIKVTTLSGDIIIYDGTYLDTSDGYPITLSNAVRDNLLDYKIYGNSVQNGTPTPTQPIEIQSVGDKTKNVANIPDISVGDANKTVECSLTKSFVISCQEYPVTIQNNNGVDTSIWRLMITYKDGSSSYVMDNALKGIEGIATFKASEENPAISITIRSTYIKDGKYSGFQVEYGTTATDYEPYGKYKIPIKVSGKNLVSELVSGYPDSSIFPQMTSTTSSVFKTVKLKNLKAGTYTFSFEKPVNIVRSMSTSSHDSNISIPTSATSNIKVATITLTQDEQEYYLSFRDTTSSTTNWSGWVQCEKGNIATAYEPYKVQSYNIYLDEPLRKVGAYEDYIDFETKTLYRRIAQSQLNNQTSFGKFGGVTNYSAFYLEKDDILIYGDGNPVSIPILSNKFEYRACGTANTNSKWTKSYQIGGSVSSTYKRICFTLPNTITDTASAKEWLKDNPIDYFYPLNNPIEETIQLPDIQLYKGINTITVDTEIVPSNISVKYNAKQ